MRETSDNAPSAPSGGRRVVNPLEPLRFPAFRLLTLSTVPHLLSMQMSSVAMGYLAYTLSGEARALGLMGLGWGIPMLSLSLVGGVVADRFPRRVILIGSQGLVGLSAVVGAVLLLLNMMELWHLFVMALMQGSAFAFNMPARQALIAEYVEAASLGSAIALNNTVMNAMRVLGPPVAGILIARPEVGAKGVYVVMAACYVLVLILLACLPRTETVQRGPRRSGWQDLKGGVSFIAGSPLLLGLLALGFLPMFLGQPHQMLLPVFALGVFGGDAGVLGFLSMASGAGAVVGSVMVATVVGGARMDRVQLGLGLGFGLSLVAFVLSRDLVLASLFLAVAGAASAGYQSLNNTLLMQATPRQFHGRVMSVYMMTWAIMPLATLPASWLADVFSPQLTIGVMGVLLAVAVLALNAWLRRAAGVPAGEGQPSVAAD